MNLFDDKLVVSSAFMKLSEGAKAELKPFVKLFFDITDVDDIRFLKMSINNYRPSPELDEETRMEVGSALWILKYPLDRITTRS